MSQEAQESARASEIVETWVVCFPPGHLARRGDRGGGLVRAFEIVNVTLGKGGADGKGGAWTFWHREARERPTSGKLEKSPLPP